MHSHKVKKTSGFRKLPAIIRGSHVHRFADNAKLGIDAFGPGPSANLPVACALPEPLGSFRDFLRMVENEFRIDGLSEFLAPPGWQGMF